MKLKKIYLFASVSNQYGVIDHFTSELNNAFNRQGVISRIIEAKRDDPKGFLDQLINDPPDCTLSFNGLLPDENGNFLSDMIKIPHVAFLTDAPNHYFPLLKSSYTILSCIDRNFAQVFKDFKFPYVLFNPHAVNKSLARSLSEPPIYDLLMLNSFIDFEVVRAKWADKYSPALSQVLEEAAELTLDELTVPYMQAFIQTLDRHLRAGKAIEPRLLNYDMIFDDLEAYLGGKARVELVQSVEDATVHIVGSNSKGWKKYVGHQPNVKLLPAVPFTEALELMKKTKILLNCTPEIKQGLHERILSGLVSGAAVLTLQTPYLNEHFKDGEDLLMYAPRAWKDLNAKIRLYLNDEDKRNHLVGKGRENVLKNHTWDQRALNLMEQLPPMINKIKGNL
ncbi:MAG: glycosyltransferase family 1 protein [Candidatus Protochlamydia sp.]|nr:glycosyltransferase family 1 protein [Candidatus Protochlamydia sp.]